MGFGSEYSVVVLCFVFQGVFRLLGLFQVTLVFFFCGVFLIRFKWCSVVLIGVRLSWAIQVTLGCLQGCLGLLLVVSRFSSRVTFVGQLGSLGSSGLSKFFMLFCCVMFSQVS